MDSGSLDRASVQAQNAQGRKVNVQVTPDDIVVCTCGCSDFMQPIYIYKVKSPLIGEKPIVTIQPNQAAMLVCANCNKPLLPEELRSKADREGGLLGVAKNESLMPIDAMARMEAARILSVIGERAAQYNVSPEEFAELLEKESQTLSALNGEAAAVEAQETNGGFFHG